MEVDIVLPRPSEVSLSGGAGYAQVCIPSETSIKKREKTKSEFIRPWMMLDTLELMRPRMSLSGQVCELIRPMSELIRPGTQWQSELIRLQSEFIRP